MNVYRPVFVFTVSYAACKATCIMQLPLNKVSHNLSQLYS